MTRVVLVTGANAGIGHALASALIARGDRVAAVDLQVDALRPSEALLPLVADVSDAASVARAVESVRERWGRIDVAVNNAAIARFSAADDPARLENARAEWSVNVLGAWNVCLAVRPMMRAQGGGVIHNVGSAVGFTGFPRLPGYCASKGALEALTRTLALEWAAEGIAVNMMHPPLTRTSSASPLGVPVQAMKEPAVVGGRLARKVGSRRAVVTPDLSTALFVRMARRYPGVTGRLLARLTSQARGA